MKGEGGKTYVGESDEFLLRLDVHRTIFVERFFNNFLFRFESFADLIHPEFRLSSHHQRVLQRNEREKQKAMGRRGEGDETYLST